MRQRASVGAGARVASPGGACGWRIGGVGRRPWEPVPVCRGSRGGLPFRRRGGPPGLQRAGGPELLGDVAGRQQREVRARGRVRVRGAALPLSEALEPLRLPRVRRHFLGPQLAGVVLPQGLAVVRAAVRALHRLPVRSLPAAADGADDLPPIAQMVSHVRNPINVVACLPAEALREVLVVCRLQCHLVEILRVGGCWGHSAI
mmetsp:Transcript_38464/g.86724  ORF Transcript_38464/g.86724 Transcript_38464/m.86724 type:complete len:203 (-) Transcript_38464:63-671(-)